MDRRNNDSDDLDKIDDKNRNDKQLHFDFEAEFGNGKDLLTPEERAFYNRIMGRNNTETTDHHNTGIQETNTKDITANSINSIYFKKQDRKHSTPEGIAFNTSRGKIDNLQFTPVAIRNNFDKHIVGQDEAKETMAVAIYEHLKRMELEGIEKSNILLVGPTGSGKTLFARCLAEMLGVPFTIADASTLTEAGYVGQDVESILTPLLKQANGDIALVERSVVFIDEIDKIAKNNDRGNDIARLGVQQELLKLLEGSIVSVPTNRAASMGRGIFVDVDTSNILFICGGAFPELEEFVEKRAEENSFGFFSRALSKDEKKEKLYKEATTEDFESFGMLPEFMGRLPIVAFLNPLSKDIYRKILTEPEDSILSQFKKSFAYDDANLTITDAALDAIAEEAFSMGTGARALRTILNRVLKKPMYLVPSQEGKKMVIVTEDNVVNGTVPEIKIVDLDPETRKA